VHVLGDDVLAGNDLLGWTDGDGSLVDVTQLVGLLAGQDCPGSSDQRIIARVVGCAPWNGFQNSRLVGARPAPRAQRLSSHGQARKLNHGRHPLAIDSTGVMWAVFLHNSSPPSG
jgi:hypothetical protein